LQGPCPLGFNKMQTAGQRIASNLRSAAGAADFAPWGCTDIRQQSVNDQDAGVKYSKWINHENRPLLRYPGNRVLRIFQCKIKRLHEFVDLNRLGNIAEKSCLHTSRNVKRHCIGGNGNDRDMRRCRI